MINPTTAAGGAVASLAQADGERAGDTAAARVHGGGVDGGVAQGEEGAGLMVIADGGGAATGARHHERAEADIGADATGGAGGERRGAGGRAMGEGERQVVQV